MSDRWEHPELFETFVKWKRQNDSGGWGTRWRRRPVWIAQIAQKLGLSREVTTRLFFGEPMRVVTNEEVSVGILTYGYTEVALTTFMLRILKAGDTMVDVGTHFGYEAMLGCRLVGREGRVVSFEPNPRAFAIAARNLGRFPQAELRPQGVGASAGTLRLEVRPMRDIGLTRLAADVPAESSIEVPVTTLDEALRGRTRPVSFVKVDVEGFEMQVLLGASELLARDAPPLVLEADFPSRDGALSARAYQLADYLKPAGYDAFNFDFDLEHGFRFEPIGAFPVQHANVAFVPRARHDLLARLLGVERA